MVSYKERLAAALKFAGVTDAQLAKDLKVSIQAVRKVAAGTTTAFTAENNSKAAHFLRVDPDWLATGEGEMISTSGWPGTRFTLAEIHQWPKEVLKSVEEYALFQLAGAKTPSSSDSSTGNNELTSSQKKAWTHPELDAIKQERKRSGKSTSTEEAAKRRSRGGA